MRPEGPGDPGGSSRNCQSRLTIAVLLAAVLLTLCYQTYRQVDWELLQTKHYWNSQEWYYGGYAVVFASTPQGLRPIQNEAFETNYHNLSAFGETVEPSLRKHRTWGFPGTERLAVPYLASLVVAATGGLVDAWTVFLVLNVALYLSAVFFACRLASIYFGDRHSMWFAGLLLALYPAYTLNFHGLKIASIGTTFLLGGMYLFETRLRDRPAWLRFAVLAALLFLGQFAGGGWLFLFIFLLVRLPGEPREVRLLHGLTLGFALLAALAAFTRLKQTYGLPTIDQQMPGGYLGMLFQSYDWIAAWAAGENVAAHRLLNYPGFNLFWDFLPLIASSFILGHWVLILLSALALAFVPATRKLVLPFLLLLAAGHGGMALSGWTHHYGYLSAPAAMMLILAAAAFLGMLWSQGSPGRKAAAGLLLAAVLFGFLDEKRHAGLYFGGKSERYLPRVVIHYQDSDATVEY